MSYLNGGSSSLGDATVSGLNDIYCDNLYTSNDIIADGDLTCQNIISNTTTDLQDQIDAIIAGIAENNGYWGAFFSTINQANTTANVPNYATVNTADPNNEDVVMYNGTAGNYSEIQVLNAGVYNVQFSFQVTHTNSSMDYVNIWFRVNGADVPNSNSSVNLKDNGQDLVPAWNIILKLNALDRVSIMWASAMTAISLKATPATTSPYVSPLVPSVIITVQQIINTSQGIQGPPGPQGQQGIQGVPGPMGPGGVYVLDPITQGIIDGLVTDVAGLDADVTALDTTVGGLVTDVATLDTDVSALDGDVGILNDKTVNILSATPGTLTTFDGAILCEDLATSGIEGTTLGLTISAPEPGLGGVMNLEATEEMNMTAPFIELTGTLTINGVLYVPWNPINSFFIQF